MGCKYSITLVTTRLETTDKFQINAELISIMLYVHDEKNLWVHKSCWKVQIGEMHHIE
jgi:hypothetical protein